MSWFNCPGNSLATYQEEIYFYDATLGYADDSYLGYLSKWVGWKRALSLTGVMRPP